MIWNKLVRLRSRDLFAEMRAGQFARRRISPDNFPRHISGGGNTIDSGTHWVRALRMFMGEIVRVVAINERPLAAMAGESLTHAIVRFQSGKSASFDCLVSSISGTEMSSECSLYLCVQHSKLLSLPLKLYGFLCAMGGLDRSWTPHCPSSLFSKSRVRKAKLCSTGRSKAA